MASAGSESLVGGSANDSINLDVLEAEAGVVNAKYPLWAHATKLSADELLLRMEQEILKFIHDPRQTRFEFQGLPTSYLRLASHRLAQHYFLQSIALPDTCMILVPLLLTGIAVRVYYIMS